MLVSSVRDRYGGCTALEVWSFNLPDDVCCLLELEKKVHMKVCIHGEGPYQKKVILRDCEIFGNLHLTFVSSSIVYSPGCGQEERCRQDNHKHCPIRASESWYILPVEDRGMSEPDNIQYYFSPVIISKYNILTDKRYLSVTRRLCSMLPIPTRV